MTDMPSEPAGVSAFDHNALDHALDRLRSKIVAARMIAPPERALLVGVSGIDGSGKGFVAKRVDERLRRLGWNVAAISADDWLNVPDVYMNADNPAGHFYENALRLDDMF